MPVDFISKVQQERYGRYAGEPSRDYIRPETIARANARLVDFQAQLPLAQLWGGVRWPRRTDCVFEPG
jgi:hypothetical protein